VGCVALVEVGRTQRDEYRLYIHPIVLGSGSHSSPAPGRGSALWPATALAGM
jgi:hypothetical protein